MPWTIGEAARLAKVSVRTLHHYDQIGLLSPSARSDSGYRLYGADDLDRLHRILLFKELGFSLDEIGRIILDPNFDEVQALRAQRALLAEKARRTEAMLASIDTAIATAEKGAVMTEEERSKMFGDLFDGFDPAEYKAEAEDRWGETDAYKQSMARTKRYTKADWEQIKEENEAYLAKYVAAMDADLPADSPEALAAAAEHHTHLEKWFYDAPLEMFGCLAEMWVGDPRFTKNIDKVRPGLAQYQHNAVKAWVASQRA